jgi:GTP cyclohydrolase I/GTP cyclohydrolase-4
MNDRGPLLAPETDDVQMRRPSAALALSRVGVTGMERVLRIGAGAGDELFAVALECYVDLGAEQRGAHMSRFEETVNEAIDAAVRRGSFSAPALAAEVAEEVRERQGARRSEVHVTARAPEERAAPASGARSQEIGTLLGAAVARPRGTRRLTGVRAHGLTACPCAQVGVEARSRERLAAEGFGPGEVERILRAVPVATHNQRGVGTLWIGCPENCEAPIDAGVLRGIVRAAMSSEVFELMKRADEVEVVERAHRRPRFVEDCVREMVGATVAAFASLGPDAFVLARQENLESIHRHDVVAERSGLMGELERALAEGDDAGRHVSMPEWLEGPAD